MNYKRKVAFYAICMLVIVLAISICWVMASDSSSIQHQLESAGKIAAANRPSEKAFGWYLLSFVGGIPTLIYLIARSVETIYEKWKEEQGRQKRR